MAYDYSQHAGASNNNSYNPGRTSGNSLAVPTPSRPYAGSRKGSHASGASVDLTDGDGYYADKGIAELDADVPLELDTFQAPDFNVGRLVSSLTDSLIAESKQGGGGEGESIIKSHSTSHSEAETEVLLQPSTQQHSLAHWNKLSTS